MDDKSFISKLNKIARDHELVLPALREDETPTDGFLADWTGFLESSVKSGIMLSDPRWQRLSILKNTPHARFSLEDDEGDSPDPDFRIGLQLLLGMLEDDIPE